MAEAKDIALLRAQVLVVTATGRFEGES